MNNIEVFDDFEKLVKQIHGTELSQREKMLIQMAINHTFLVLKSEDEDETK